MPSQANPHFLESFAARRSRFVFAVLFLGFSLILSGCTQTKVLKSKSALEGRVGPSVVLLVEPDVQLSLLTAAGLEEPHAEWTEAGRRNVADALDALFREKNVSVIPYRQPRGDPDKAHRHNQIMKMHQAVGVSILQHVTEGPGPPVKFGLPTKADRFEWTLGPGTQTLKDEFGADYALFIYLRDSFTSPGRGAMVALAVLGCLAGACVPVGGGIQVGFASLVNLDTGEIVWFNRLISDTGDLRTPEPARQAIDHLLTEVPL